jgi:hypothetical protein
VSTPTRRARTYRAEREFGWIVGGILLALGAWWLYRDKLELARTICLSVGGVLVVFATVAPRLLVWPNRGWMALAEVLGRIVTTIILAFVYFIVLTPIGVVLRVRGWDPLLRRTKPQPSYWRPYSERQRDPRHFEKMY